MFKLTSSLDSGPPRVFKMDISIYGQVIFPKMFIDYLWVAFKIFRGFKEIIIIILWLNTFILGGLLSFNFLEIILNLSLWALS